MGDAKVNVFLFVKIGKTYDYQFYTIIIQSNLICLHRQYHFKQNL